MKTITIVTYFPTHVGGLYSHMQSLASALESKGLKVNLVFNDINPIYL